MAIEDLFPSKEFSATELELISEIFSNPVVKKYLQLLALEDTKELLAFSAISNPDPEIIKAHANVQGKLSVLSTLASISNQSKE